MLTQSRCALPLLVFVLMIIPACSQASPAVIPKTDVTLEEFIFAPGQKVVEAVPKGTYDICFDEPMTPDFRATSITMWTGPLFRTAVKPSDLCRFGVYSKRRYQPQRGDIRTADCIARLRSRGGQVTSITMFVTEETKRHYFQCEYRLSMAFIGFQGALHLSEARLFVADARPATTYGLPIERAFSPIMPRPFIRLERACGAPATGFYKPPPGQTRSEIDASIKETSCKLD